MSDELAIEASGLAKSYRDVRVLAGVDLRVPRAACSRCSARTGPTSPVRDCDNSLLGTAHRLPGIAKALCCAVWMVADLAPCAGALRWRSVRDLRGDVPAGRSRICGQDAESVEAPGQRGDRTKMPLVKGEDLIGVIALG